mgnify:CR=1 FL=1
MPKGDVVLASFVIIAVLLAPIGLAYVCDQMRTYTVLEPKFSAANYVARVSWKYKNSTGSALVTDIDYTTDGDDIIVPCLPDVDFSETIAIWILLNGSRIVPKDLWDAGVVKLIAYVEIPNTQSREVQLWIMGYDADAGKWVKINKLSKTPNATSWTWELDYTTVMLSKYASYDQPDPPGYGLELDLCYLDVGPGDYIVFRAIWYVSKAPFSAEQAELLLLGSGIVMIACAAFATPYLSLKQLEALGRRRR